MYPRNVLAASASSNNRPTIVPDRLEKHIRPTRNGVDELYIDLLIARLTEAGDAPVLRHKGQNTSAADLLKSIYRYARTLARIGIQRGSLVALFAPNCPDALAVRYAANLVGAASYYLADPSDPQRRADLLAQTDPGLLVLFPETADLLPTGVAVQVATVGSDLNNGSFRLDERAASQSSAPMASVGRPDDLATIISSGGTTGVPKGSWRSFASYTAMVNFPSPAGRRQLINGPMANLSQVLIDVTLLGGGSVVLQDSYDAEGTLKAIDSERITDLFLVEPQLFEVMDHPDVARRDLSSLRTITHIGDLAAPTLRRRARERFGAVLAHTYGASEMGIVSALSPAEHDLARAELFSCAGRPLPGVQVRFRRDDGTLAPTGEIGNIEVRSPVVAGGYYKRPDLQTSFRDGWFRSSDLGYLDAGGYLHVRGRADEIAWINGKMVSALLLQDTLCQLSSVRYAAIVRDVNLDFWIAAVVPWPGLLIDLAQCRETIISLYGLTSVVVVRVDRVPLTPQGKVDRVAVSQLGRQFAS
jgi:fatty-acyl-CoA synthase